MCQSETVTLYKPEGMDIVIFEPTPLYFRGRRVWIQFSEDTTIEFRKNEIEKIEKRLFE